MTLQFVFPQEKLSRQIRIIFRIGFWSRVRSAVFLRTLVLHD